MIKPDRAKPKRPFSTTAGPVTTSATAGPVTTLAPTATTPVGESYRPLGLVRTSIADGRPGLPLFIRLDVRDGRGGPVRGVAVDLWHCDAAGDYSSGQGSDTFCRGRQTTNDAGAVGFITICPGWYATRAIHLHVRVATPTPDATQLFLPDPENERVRRDPIYAANRFPVVTNVDDPYWRQLSGTTLMTMTPTKGGPPSAAFALVVSSD